MLSTTIITTFMFCVVTSWAREVELDFGGGVSADVNHHAPIFPESRSVLLENTYSDKDIELFWQNPNSEEIAYMFDIQSKQTAQINTFNGHTFIVKEAGSTESLPDKVFITDKTKFYTVGPNQPKDYKFSVRDGIAPNLHQSTSKKVKASGSPLKIMGVRTSAMAAKFRCHARAVDYYYDDGEDGVFQGSLTLGKETTINTYEGHVFYFTEKGNKDVVLSRFQMSTDKVIHYKSLITGWHTREWHFSS